MAILIALKSKDIDVILSTIGNPVIKLSLTAVKSFYLAVHVFDQRVRFMPKLSRSHILAFKLNDIRWFVIF